MEPDSGEALSRLDCRIGAKNLRLHPPLAGLLGEASETAAAKGLSSPEANLGTVLGFSCRTFPGANRARSRQKA